MYQHAPSTYYVLRHCHYTSWLHSINSGRNMRREKEPPQKIEELCAASPEGESQSSGSLPQQWQAAKNTRLRTLPLNYRRRWCIAGGRAATSLERKERKSSFSLPHIPESRSFNRSSSSCSGCLDPLGCRCSFVAFVPYSCARLPEA